MIEPVKPHPSHEWGPLTAAGQGRCLRCGAYRHLSSGFFPCEPKGIMVTEQAPPARTDDCLVAALELAQSVVDQLKAEIEKRAGRSA